MLFGFSSMGSCCYFKEWVLELDIRGIGIVIFVVWSVLSVARWYWCEAESLV